MIQIYTYPKNGFIYLQYTFNNKTVYKSTRLKDTKENRVIVKNELIPYIRLSLESQDNIDITFKYYSALYLKDKSHLKSIAQIKKRLELINDIFGDMPITSITRNDIKNFVRSRLEVNKPRTVKGYITHLKAIFDIAIDHEHIIKNPVINLSLPTHITKTIEPFTPDEVKLLISLCTDRYFRYFLIVSFYTGIRTGEFLALLKDDFNILDKTLSISKSYSKGKLSTTKTKDSNRIVPLFDSLLLQLELHDSFFNRSTTFNGGLQNRWRKLLLKCNLEYRKPYSTRHTFITNMLKHSDLSIIEIAQRVGHNTTEMIIKNYAKYIKNEHLKVSRKIDIYR